jgi:hypothetical protein
MRPCASLALTGVTAPSQTSLLRRKPTQPQVERSEPWHARHPGLDQLKRLAAYQAALKCSWCRQIALPVVIADENMHFFGTDAWNGGVARSTVNKYGCAAHGYCGTSNARIHLTTLNRVFEPDFITDADHPENNFRNESPYGP